MENNNISIPGLPVLTSERVVPRIFQKSNDGENYEALMMKAVINPDCPIPEPEVILSLHGTPILWRGCKSFICAVAKARKTTALTLFASILLGKNESSFGFKAIPDCKVLFIDTEQAIYDTQKILTRVARLCGKDPKNLSKLTVLSVNRQPSDVIKGIMEEAIRKFKPDVLMLDNWTDCVISVLDEKDCTKFSQDLRAIAEQYNLAIFSVIHANEGDSKNDKPKFRGWAVEEARKSDLTLYLKDMSAEPKAELRGDYSKAMFGKCRGKRPDNFAISIDDNGLPYLYVHNPTVSPDSSEFDAILTKVPHGGIRNNGLIQIISEVENVDKRTCQRRIKKMVENGLLVKRGVNNDILYYLPKDIIDDMELPF